MLEPGRSVVGRAGVALYSVGARKEIPGVRTYVAVDGGMADNIRPAIYDARYEAIPAYASPGGDNEEPVTVAGKYCESGDILVRDVALPRLQAGRSAGDPGLRRLLPRDGEQLQRRAEAGHRLRRRRQARLVRRRETYADLMACETE